MALVPPLFFEDNERGYWVIPRFHFIHIKLIAKGFFFVAVDSCDLNDSNQIVSQFNPLFLKQQTVSDFGRIKINSPNLFTFIELRRTFDVQMFDIG